MQLGAFNHGSFVLGQAAMMINEGLPYLLVQDIKRAYPLSEMTVGILGMAFKPEQRRSALLACRTSCARCCCWSARQVLCTDPYVPDPELTPLAEVLDQADLLIVGTPHDCYKGLTYRQPVIDVTDTIRSVSRRLEAACKCRRRRRLNGRTDTHENPRHRLRRLHRRLPGRRTAPGRPRRRRPGQLLQVRRR